MMSRGRTVLVTSLVAVVVFVVTHVASFPGSVSHFRQVTNGQVILDLRPSSSAAETWQRLDAMGEAGRAAYVKLVAVVDVIFPLSVAAALFTLALFVARRLSLRRSLTIALAMLPLLYFVLDLAENAVVLRLLLAFPERLDTEGALVGILTRAKRIAQLAALFTPLALVAGTWVYARTRGRTGARAGT